METCTFTNVIGYGEKYVYIKKSFSKMKQKVYNKSCWMCEWRKMIVSVTWQLSWSWTLSTWLGNLLTDKCHNLIKKKCGSSHSRRNVSIVGYMDVKVTYHITEKLKIQLQTVHHAEPASCVGENNTEQYSSPVMLVPPLQSAHLIKNLPFVW